MSMRKIASKMVDYFGETVSVRPRIITMVNDEREITYGDQYGERVQVSQITGDYELLEKFGVLSRSDYIMTAKHSSIINTGDLVQYNDIWFEVTDRLPRKTRSQIDYIDFLLKRREG